jgi:hypothetical protein
MRCSSQPPQGGGRPRGTPRAPWWAPGWYVLPAASIAKWRCVLVGNTHHKTVPTFVAVASAARMLRDSIGRHIWVMCASQPPADGGSTEDSLERVLRAELRVARALGGVLGKDATEGQVEETIEVSGGEEVREKEDKPGARANTATFVAAILAVMFLMEPVGCWIWVTHAVRPHTASGNLEYVLALAAVAAAIARRLCALLGAVAKDYAAPLCVLPVSLL